jgi:RNA polymerase sigma factor (sigma-70 family)
LAAEGSDPDEALLAGVGRGDPSAVRQLLDRRLPRVLALARRMLNDPGEAEDVAQETFLRAWKQARSWRPGGAKFDTWLHRVALNLCYDRLRRRREVATAEPPEQVDTGPAPDAGLLGADLSKTGRDGLGRLARPTARGDRAVPSPGAGQYRGRALMTISVEALESLLGAVDGR